MLGVIKPKEAYSLKFLGEFFCPNCANPYKWAKDHLIDSGLVPYVETKNGIAVRGRDLINSLGRFVIEADDEKYKAYLEREQKERERKIAAKKRSSQKNENTE